MGWAPAAFGGTRATKAAGTQRQPRSARKHSAHWRTPGHMRHLLRHGASAVQCAGGGACRFAHRGS
jgi:hypothetical protein